MTASDHKWLQVTANDYDRQQVISSESDQLRIRLQVATWDNEWVKVALSDCKKVAVLELMFIL